MYVIQDITSESTLRLLSYLRHHISIQNEHISAVMDSNRIKIFATNMAVNFVVMVRISLVSLLINQLSLSLSIKVERNYRDTFQNPDCLTTDADCSRRPCSRYSARCLTSACKFCECYDDDGTFTFQEGNIIGRCMSTDQFVQFPGKSLMNVCIDPVSIWNMRPPFLPPLFFSGSISSCTMN